MKYTVILARDPSIGIGNIKIKGQRKTHDQKTREVDRARLLSASRNQRLGDRWAGTFRIIYPLVALFNPQVRSTCARGILMFF